MPYRDLHFAAGEYYHLYNRGTNRERLFFEPDNERFFLQRLAEHLLPHTELLAYCLMPNHYHLLIRCLTAVESEISRAMQRIGVSYSKAINKRYDRTGPLFQGPFQVRHINDYAYLSNISAYIHLNPVAAHLVAAPEEWAASSYREYIGRRVDPLVTTGPILSLFGSAQRYAAHVLTYRPADEEKILRWTMD